MDPGNFTVRKKGASVPYEDFRLCKTEFPGIDNAGSRGIKSGNRIFGNTGFDTVKFIFIQDADVRDVIPDTAIEEFLQQCFFRIGKGENERTAAAEGNRKIVT